MIQLCTVFSETHRRMYNEYLVPSLPRDVILHTKELAQVCPTGAFASPGFSQAMKGKLEYVREMVVSNLGGHIMYVDTDVQFFAEEIEGTLLAEIGDCDIACQQDSVEICAGVMFIKCYQYMVEWLDRCLANFHKISGVEKSGDQAVVNYYRKQVNWKYLSSRFWNRSFKSEPPDDMVLHHANWIVGIEAKLQALEDIKCRYRRKLAK